MKCRHCATPLEHIFADLGYAPPSNAYLIHDDLSKPEKYYPLKVLVCTTCWLVQTEDFAQADELFSAEYAYFSSTSSSWLEHARSYTEYVCNRFNLNENSFVVEVASNDGYLLKNFVERKIPCLGIEPTASTASVAESLGVPVIREFFGETLGQRLGKQLRQADLIVGNNVYAHVPDINDFTLGLKAALKPSGSITLEFPHLMCLLEKKQFDTIYHEHFSYLSLFTVCRIFNEAGLRVFDVEELPTHGGSLRVFGCHAQDERVSQPIVREILNKEKASGLLNLASYLDFQEKIKLIKLEFLDFLLQLKKINKTVAAYGAAAKGNTLLNFSGVKPDLLPFVVDAAPAKQGKYLPGSHLPILNPAYLRSHRPDYIIIFPWNITDEVRKQNSDLADLGTHFVTLIPKLEIL